MRVRKIVRSSCALGVCAAEPLILIYPVADLAGPGFCLEGENGPVTPHAHIRRPRQAFKQALHLNMWEDDPNVLS